MSTSTLALALAGLMVAGLVFGLGIISLLVGAIDRYFGKPQLALLRSRHGAQGFAFRFQWNEAKEPAKYHALKLKLFNPFGTPSQMEIVRPFPKQGESFEQDILVGSALETLARAKNLDRARVQVEVESVDGVSYLQEYKALHFLELREQATEAVATGNDEEGGGRTPVSWGSEERFWTVGRDFIADTVPGKGAQVAISSNPAFAAFFQGTAAGASAGAVEVEAAENFSVTKVWIEDGCIVCNACEDVYPEVFKVIADGCEVRPGHPADDGLKVEEAAEACPVEIIKFTKAA